MVNLTERKRMAEQARNSPRPPGVPDGQWAAFERWRQGEPMERIAHEMRIGRKVVLAYVRRVRLALGLVVPGIDDSGVLRGRLPDREESFAPVTGQCGCGLRLFGGEPSCGDCSAGKRAEDYRFVGAEGGPARRVAEASDVPRFDLGGLGGRLGTETALKAHMRARNGGRRYAKR
jgi:hypothetical protein